MPKRILLIKPSALGDVVHALPVLHLLRLRFPEAHITWLVAPPWKPLIERHPDLNDTLVFDRRGLSSAALGEDGVGRVVGLTRELADRQFDLVLDLQGLLRSALMTWATHAPYRIGFDYAREGAWMAYTHRIPTPHTERHAIERYLDVAEALGCGRAPVRFDFGHREAERVKIATLVEPFGTYAVLLPGTNWDTKRWPVEHFDELARRLRAEMNLRVVVAGANDAVPLAREIEADLNLAGQTTLRELISLLECASLVIANDSGPMHIASALNRPLVTPFGPTNPVRTGPYARLDTVVRLDVACSPCYSRRCSHTSCMQWLTPDMVFQQARSAIDRSEIAAR